MGTYTETWQTLNFKPFRVNLTPFAGILSDGDAHTVGISVYNANSYFLATANLLVFTDPHAQRTNGGLLNDTLTAAPTPVVTENLNKDSSGNITGTVGVSSARSYSISGWTTTSHGRVETTVNGSVNFSNNQKFTINASQYLQDIAQATTMDVQQQANKAFFRRWTQNIISIRSPSYTTRRPRRTDRLACSASPDQVYQVTDDKSLSFLPIFHSEISNQVASTDTLLFDASGHVIGPSNVSSTHTYKARNTLGYCYGRKLTSASNKLTAVEDVSCH